MTANCKGPIGHESPSVSCFIPTKANITERAVNIAFIKTHFLWLIQKVILPILCLKYLVIPPVPSLLLGMAKGRKFIDSRKAND